MPLDINMIAAGTAAANCALHSLVAGLIWWRIMTQKVSVIITNEDKWNNAIFILAGAVFTLFAVTYFMIALGMARLISWETWTIGRITADTASLLIALYGSYLVTRGKFHLSAPFVLLAFIVGASTMFVWIAY